MADTLVLGTSGETRAGSIPVSTTMRLKAIKREQLQDLVAESTSYADALRKLGMNSRGGNYISLKLRIQREQIDISHFTGQAHLKGKKCDWYKRVPLSDILVKDSKYLNTSTLRRRLISAGLLTKVCSCCGNSEWLGKEIPLELDHINGIRTDNRLENLRLLCPNCHAQTDTYRGKNIGKAT